MRINLSNSKTNNGFSLIEVVMAVAIVAIAIPTMLGMFAYFSKASVETKDFSDSESVTNAVLLFLENDPQAGFETVYQWVTQARQNPAQAQVLYVYKKQQTSSQSNGPAVVEEAAYTVTLSPPQDSDISLSDGRIMAVEVQAPDTRIIETFTGLDAYDKTYLPIKIDIYAVNSPTQERKDLLETYPAVIFR